MIAINTATANRIDAANIAVVAADTRTQVRAWGVITRPVCGPKSKPVGKPRYRLAILPLQGMGGRVGGQGSSQPVHQQTAMLSRCWVRSMWLSPMLSESEELGSFEHHDAHDDRTIAAF